MKGPPVPTVSWESSLCGVRLDYSGLEIKFPEPVTSEQLEPVLLPAESAGLRQGCELSTQLKEFWKNTCPISAVSLASGGVLHMFPKAKVWVENDEVYIPSGGGNPTPKPVSSLGQEEAGGDETTSPQLQHPFRRKRKRKRTIRRTKF